jgi:polyphosphate glucokinase
VVRQLLDHFGWDGPFGCTFPAVVQHGVVRTAANVDRSWIGTDGHELLAKATGRAPLLVNDADAAGVAEARFGAAKHVTGVALVSTLGTGIGSALLVGGTLVPNTELGHLEIDGHDAESKAADSAREREELSWADWADRLTRYYGHLENLFWPDLIVVGGGVSKKADKWLGLVRTRTELVAAKLRNDAGIVGAAVLAAEHHQHHQHHRSS